MSLHADTGLPAEYDRLHVGTFLYDPATAMILDANERGESLLGYDTADLRGMPVDEYTANTYSRSGDQFAARIREAAAGDQQRFKWRIKRADGELIWAQIHLSQLGDDGRTAVLAQVQDITDHYTASRRVGLFSRILRHNLRNEMNVIAGHAEQIQAGTDSPAVRDAATTIHSTAMDLGGITKSVKEIERATDTSARRDTLRDAADAVTEVVEEFRREHPAADIDVEERTPMWIRVDDAFDHALGHAIENAITHSEQSHPTVEVAVDASPNTGRVEIRIADRCDSIPDFEIDALDPSKQTTSTSHGSGVGLFVMKWCIESLGGELTFETRDDRGNVVSFYLPPKEPAATG